MSMTLLDYLKAFEAGQVVEVKYDHGNLGPARTWVAANSQDDIAEAWCKCTAGVRIAPELQTVDLSVLFDSGIDCEFKDSRGDYQVGKMKDYYSREFFESTMYYLDQCRPRMDHWHAWNGGKCPVPEGLLIQVRYSTRGESSHPIPPSDLCGCPSPIEWGEGEYQTNIIAFKVVGLAAGWRWPWGDDK